jgi:two-component system cell cycle sensor histidine kinase/response regulator CckA
MTKRHAKTTALRRSPPGEARISGIPHRRGASPRDTSTSGATKSPDGGEAGDFRELAEFLPLAIFESDSTGRLTYANSRAFEYFGYSAEDIERGINLLEMVVADDRARARENMQEIHRGHLTQGAEYTALRRDGSTFSAMAYASAIKRDGRTVGIRGAVVDITDRKLVEKALRENEERFRNIVEKSDAIFYVHGIDHVFTYLSPQVEKLLGYAPEQSLRRWADAVSDNPVNKRAYELTQKAIDTGERQPPYEVELIAKGGRRVWFEVNEAPLVRDGRTVAVIGAAQDVTERRRVQQELRKLGAVVHCSSELVNLATPDGKMIFINEAGERMLGISAAEVKRYRIYDVIPDEQMETVREKIVPTLLNGGRWEGELRYKNIKTGGITDVHALAFSIRDRQRKSTLYFVNVSRDITDQKRVGDALRERQAKLDSIFRAAPIGISIVRDRVLLEVNDRICEMTGYAAEELVGKSARMLYMTDQEYDYVGHEKYSQMATKGIGSVETRWLRKDGSAIDVLLSTAPLVSGDLSGDMTFTALDITERRRAEEGLRAGEMKYRRLVETLQEGIWAIDRDGVTTFVNPRMAEMLGYSDEEMLGRHASSFMDERGAEDWRAYLERRNRGIGEQHDLEFIHKSGGRVYVRLETSRLTDENGDYIGVIAGVQDITERKQAEEALRQSEEKFRTIVDTTSEWIWELGLDGQHVYSNPAIESILGYRPEEILGKAASDFVHDDDKEMVREILRSHIERGTGWRDTVIRWRHKDGTYRYLESNATPLFDQGGELTGFRGADRDITERRRAEEERKLLEMQIQRTQKLESLGILAGGIAHDFNNILMAIRGNLEFATAALSPDSPARRNLDDVDRASRRAADLCKQLLAYSGKGRFAAGPLDLAKVVEEMGQMLIVSISKKAVLRIDCAPALPMIEADEIQIQQVVMNLIINASEALKDGGGVITVSAGAIDCDRAYLRGMLLGEDLPEGRYVYLDVADDGCGMDEETQAKIFDPFFSTKFAGRGLGLAAVLGIVRGHRGAVRISSETGAGTTFRIIFPAAARAVAQVEECPAQTGDWHGSGTVLLVDDEEMVRCVARRMLEHLGFRVLLAGDGVEAIEVFRSQRDAIACVILDLTMPRMDGIETLAALRAISGDVSVILSSGYSEYQISKRYARKGFAGFIEKPYLLATLAEKIRSVLGERMRRGIGQ